MTRQKQLEQIGEMGVENYSSKFIIPLPHKFYKNSVSIFDQIEKNGWKLENKHPEKKDKDEKIIFQESKYRQLDAFNIKEYIYDNMIPQFDKNSKATYLEDFKSLLLKKEINKNIEFTYTRENIKTEFVLKEVDLWIFEEHIAFFVLNIDLEHEKYTINELSKFHNSFRAFKNIQISENNLKLYLNETAIFDGEKTDMLDFLLDLTFIKDKSFLNIDSKSCITLSDELSNIYNTTINAKLLLGIETQSNSYSNGTLIEENNLNCINILRNSEMSILSEAPYYLASCSLFQTTPSCTPDDSYIYSLVQNGGFDIWKYSAGITLHDSCALIGLKEDGGPIVENVNGPFYFIYILNLYINFQIRYIENKIIDRNFESIDINYWYKKLQKLKNQFVTEDVAVKFQENEFHRSIFGALKTNGIINEVSTNIVETKEITHSNTGIYMTLVGYIFVSIFQDPLTKIAKDYGIFIIPVVLITGYFIYKNRIKIRNKFKL